MKVRVQEGKDWVLFTAGDPAPEPDMLPSLLAKAVDEWTMKHHECRIRTALSIVRSGNTIGVRLWFDGLPS